MKKIAIIFFIIIFIPYNCVFCDDYDENDDTEEIELIHTIAPTNSEVKLNSKSAIVYERNSKTVLFEKNADSMRPMASTTKIMTCIVVLENADLNKIVTISSKAANIGGSKLKLKKGDKITIHDLLYGLMLRSGNDAAIALAEEIGESIEGFAEMMNKKAIELGLKNTHFVTPHGLDSNGHYTTAKELALLTNYALTIPKFKEIVGMHSYILTINGQSRTINNTNELLGYLDGVYGVKTGFTNGAGRCLITSTKRNKMDIICVVLGADTKKFRTQDSMKLIEYSFKNFQLIDLKNNFIKTFENINIENKITVIKGKQKHLQLELQDSPSLVCIRNTDIDNIKFNINLANTIFAPVEQNKIVGTINAMIDDYNIISKNIYAKQEIPAKNIWDYMIEMLKNYAIYISYVINSL